MLFTIDEIEQATGGKAQNVARNGVTAIVIDSRDVPEGALFVAIQGDRHDGHDFALSALENGVAAALVRRDFASQNRGAALIGVDDPLQAMGDMARAARARSEARIAAVTGSVGKTTTKEALRHILAGAGIVHASIKSYNNHWGVPLMLSNLPIEADFGVFEMGMNHPGEITPLTQMVRPDVALITAIAAAHIGEMGSMEAIADAKAEIFTGLEPGGTAIINVDHEYGARLVNAARQADAGRIVTYGFADDADVRIAGFRKENESFLADISHGDSRRTVTLSVPGRHMMSNSIGAGLAAEALGVGWDVVENRLASFAAPDGRGAAYDLHGEAGQITLIDESYNANSASMRAALDVFAATPAQGRRILVLGEMRELGAFSDQLHMELVEPIVAAKPDMVFLVGADMTALGEVLRHRVDDVIHAAQVDEISVGIVDLLEKGDLIMLKGSNGVGLGRLVHDIRHRFSPQSH